MDLRAAICWCSSTAGWASATNRWLPFRMPSRRGSGASSLTISGASGAPWPLGAAPLHPTTTCPIWTLFANTSASSVHVSSLTLADTGVADATAMRKGGEALGRRIADLQREGLIPDPIPTTNCRDRFLAVTPAYFANPRFTPPSVMVRRTCDNSGRSSVLDAFINAPYTSGVRSATVPALVLVGASDPLGPASHSAAAMLAHARVTLVELASCGHLGWLECPQPFLDAVRGFLGRIVRER